jgi:hypothetical protein
VTSHDIARLAQNRLSKLKRVGYSHPPIKLNADASRFHVLADDGDKFEVTVRLLPLGEG